MPTDVELIEKIEDSFDCESPLGFGHTLAACEYYDTWRWFPEDGDLRINSGIADAEAIDEKWPEEVKSEMLEEMQKKQTTYKKYGFSEVKAKYLYDFCFGIPYLNQREFKFYLAAWMIHVIKNDMDHGFVNDSFFHYIEDYCAVKPTLKRAEYTEPQHEAIANFLFFLNVRGRDFSWDGENCLNLGWSRYLS